MENWELDKYGPLETPDTGSCAREEFYKHLLLTDHTRCEHYIAWSGKQSNPYVNRKEITK